MESLSNILGERLSNGIQDVAKSLLNCDMRRPLSTLMKCLTLQTTTSHSLTLHSYLSQLVRSAEEGDQPERTGAAEVA